MRLTIAPAESSLPPLHQRWLAELVGEVPRETSATCRSCVKLAPAGQPMGPDDYHPDTKCCTYLPMLHNFLVGALLDDPDPGLAEGRATVEARIDAGLAVTPLGLYATEEYLDRYDRGGRFGRDPALRCPHYLAHRGGDCGVWRHRESTCSTWFCRHDLGESGRRFWREGAAPLLRAAELALARHCAAALGAGECEWGPWEGRSRALYRQSATLVAAMGWSEVERAGGVEVQKLVRETRRLLPR